jgi:HK97 family phage portal protein
MAFVVSSGALRGVERAAPPPVYGMRIGTTNQYRDYADLWRAQPELRTVVDFLARNIAQLGLHTFRRVSDVDRTRLIDHPLAELLGKPNPSTTPYRMMDALVHDVCIFDNAFLLKVRDDGDPTPLGLRRVRPGRIIPIGDDWLEPEGYEIIGSRGRLTVDAGDVVHFRGYNPNDDRLGTPPVESLRQVLSEEWAANVYREQLWRNGARLSGYISRPIDAPEWGPKGRERFRSEWQAQYSGDSARAGEAAILEDGMSFVPASVTPRDSQYIESRKLTREEVARSYHVPLPMVGILDHATFTNIKELHKNLYQDCLGPWLENFQQEIELQLLPDLPDTSGVYVEFNFAAKLNGSFEEQAVQLQGAVGGPYMARNEARARLNLPMIPGGDELITPLNVVVGTVPQQLDPEAPTPAEEDQPGDPAQDDPKSMRLFVKARASQRATDKTAERLARFFARQGAVIASALGAEKSRGVIKAAVPDVFDADRWNGELAADLLLVSSKLATSAARDAMAQMQLEPNDFDPRVMTGWLTAHADGVAKVLNVTTAADVAAALDGAETIADAVTAVNALFDSWQGGRAKQIATTLTASMSGFGSVEAGRHHGGEGAMKTWVTGDNPRPEHAALNGETVMINGEFSDGSRWPGGSGDTAEDCNCNCDVTISVPK